MKIKNEYLIKPQTHVRLDDFSTTASGEYRHENEANDSLEKNRKALGSLQELLYASGQHAVLVVLQAMDTGGKDGTIRHIFTGINPQGCKVTSFKVPTPLEAAHDFLWRVHAAVPPLGTIGIFNRSHYEDVLVTRVHKTINGKTAKQRFTEINNFEEMLANTGVTILKFFLHISQKEQTERLKARCDDKNKHYKISESDFKERLLWPKYQDAYEDVLSHTSQKHAPWFVIPSDHKWYRNVTISGILVESMRSLKMEYPKASFDVSKVCGQL